MSYKMITLIGCLGSAIASLLGGWDESIQTLIIFMAADWFTGGIILPAFLGKSPKSSNGSLESHAGFKGLCRKAMILFYVLIAARLDVLMGTDYLRDAVCIGFAANEALSILENAGLMGIPFPKKLKKAIDVLKTRSEISADRK